MLIKVPTKRPGLALGAGFGILVSLALAGETPVQSAPTEGRPPPREVLMASLYRLPRPQALDSVTETGYRDRPGYWKGVSDERLLRRIRGRAIQRISFNRGGSSLSLRLLFDDGSRASFKPDQTNEQTVPRKEIAAYRINRLLGLSRVPPATWRVITPKELFTHLDKQARHLFFRIRDEARIGKRGQLSGQVSWWIPRIRYLPLGRWKERKRWYQWLKAYKRLPERHEDIARQLSTMLIFDFIINNPDRFSGFNTMATPDARFLFFMDNTYAFHPLARGGKLARTGLYRVQRFSRRFYRALKAMNAKSLDEALAVGPGAPWPLLTEEEKRAVIARRDHAVQYINAVIARYGWERTMVFP